MKSILIILPYFLNLLLIFITKPFWGFGKNLFLSLGLFFIVLGSLVWLISALTLKENYHLYKIPSQLVTKGIYSKIRHPIYLGSSLLFLGINLSWGSLWGLIYFLLIIIPYQFLRAFYEEKELVKKFGKNI